MDTLTEIRELQNQICLYENMKAYIALYKLLFNDLQRFSFAFVKSDEVAEEIVSDAFIKIWEKRETLNEIENLRLYLFAITKNFSLNYITRNYKNATLSLDDLPLSTAIELNDPENLCITADSVKQIMAAIEQLPPQCKLIFQLVKENGLKYKEVANLLHISVFTVRNQVAIAVQKIAEKLSILLPVPHSTATINSH